MVLDGICHSQIVYDSDRKIIQNYFLPLRYTLVTSFTIFLVPLHKKFHAHTSPRNVGFPYKKESMKSKTKKEKELDGRSRC